MDFCIGSDILDIGSRRSEAKIRRSREIAELTRPTHFDVPNVANVRVTMPLIILSFRFLIAAFIICIVPRPTSPAVLFG
jgi:hypothetical protein